MKNIYNSLDLPGTEILKMASQLHKPSAVLKPNSEIFPKPKPNLKPGIGGGPFKKKVMPVMSAVAVKEEDFVIEKLPTPVPPPEPPVRLSNLKWSKDQGCFDEPISISMDIFIPKSLENITRVRVAVFHQPKNGKAEEIQAKDFWAKGGQVHGGFTLSLPAKREEKDGPNTTYIFVAKHRDSKEATSPLLHVKEREPWNQELIVVIPGANELKKSGHSFQLKSMDGAINSRVEAALGEEKEGQLFITFLKLDENFQYSLSELDDQGKVVNVIFTNRVFGKWNEGGK